MPEGFKSLKEVFNKEPELSTIRNLVKEKDIISDFEKIFPELLKVAKAIKSFKCCLTVKVENSSWRHELKTKEEEIIKKINSYYNEERIKEIRFTY